MEPNSVVIFCLPSFILIILNEVNLFSRLRRSKKSVQALLTTLFGRPGWHRKFSSKAFVQTSLVAHLWNSNTNWGKKPEIKCELPFGSSLNYVLPRLKLKNQKCSASLQKYLIKSSQLPKRKLKQKHPQKLNNFVKLITQ
jgi:hypothetical protein